MASSSQTYDRLNCSICLGWLDTSSKVSSALCGHVFHKHCVTRLTQTSSQNCPCCRMPLSGFRDLFFSCAIFEQDASQEELERCYRTIENLQSQLDERMGNTIEGSDEDNFEIHELPATISERDFSSLEESVTVGEHNESNLENDFSIEDVSELSEEDLSVTRGYAQFVRSTQDPLVALYLFNNIFAATEASNYNSNHLEPPPVGQAESTINYHTRNGEETSDEDRFTGDYERIGL
ncbi:hypothetical protein L596_013779 [Steinernema carpocapsae]|uniref:RING-type domain-containing protein n=1 Tax=Steinernema carpocapsae TaxID=34508 RepID=A0A4U5P1P5_STECR|nr:hypothetical protein L596_013779 [Steinernema carpocapsae]